MANEYINNSIFEKAISRFKEAKINKEENSDEYKTAKDELSVLFSLLAENIIRAFKFRLIEHEDALQEGVMICFEKLDRFNPEFRGKNGQKAKAFNYMTTCTLNHYKQLYRSAKNYGELKKKYHKHLVEKLEEMFMSSVTGKSKFRKRPSEDV